MGENTRDLGKYWGFGQNRSNYHKKSIEFAATPNMFHNITISRKIMKYRTKYRGLFCVIYGYLKPYRAKKIPYRLQESGSSAITIYIAIFCNMARRGVPEEDKTSNPGCAKQVVLRLRWELSLKIPMEGKTPFLVKLLIPADGKCMGWKGLAMDLSNILDKRPIIKSVEKGEEKERGESI